MVETPHPTPLDIAAEDFIAHRPEYAATLSTVLLHIEAIGLPYCHDCHDWHQAAEDHSEVPIPRPREGGSAAIGTMAALACWVAAMVLVSWCLVGWFAPEPAAATRTTPAAATADLCRAEGLQTIHDVVRHRIILRDLDPAAEGRQGRRCGKGPRWEPLS